MNRISTALLAPVLLSLLPIASAQDIKSGLYAVTRDPIGIKVKLHSGGTVTLGRLLAIEIGSAKVTAVNNDNTEFHLHLEGVEPLAKRAEESRLALHVAGEYLLVTGQPRSKRGRLQASAQFGGRATAEKIAKALGTTLRLRQHPGHRLRTRLRPKADSYELGQPITLIMEIENVGPRPVSFTDGGMQRGARNNQFSFVARGGHGTGPAIPDTGNARHFGGLAGQQILKPGATFKKEVRLERWFKFTKPDTYRIAGLFRIQIGDAKDWLRALGRLHRR